MSDIINLLTLAIDKKPVEFGKAFETVIASRLSDALATRKTEIAQTLFKKPE